MVIVVGHTRWLAAKQLGMTEVPVHIADGLSPEQIRAYRIADNRTNEEAEWDLDLLAAELGDLEGLGISLDITGFDDDELRKLLGAEAIDISVENDESGSGAASEHLRVGKNKIPIGDDELETLNWLLKQYVSKNSLNHGFARWLCEGRDSV